MSQSDKTLKRYFSFRNAADGTVYVQASDEVLIVALKENKENPEVLLIIEPSPAFGESVLILPGGSIEPGEAGQNAANRELQEETGYKAARLDFLGELRPYSKYLRVRSLVYLARELSPGRLKGDEPYQIGLQSVRLAEFETLIASGKLMDSRVIAALYMARAYLNRK